MLRQAPTADRDEHRHEDRQLLGDRGEREREPIEEHLAGGLAADHADSGTITHAVTATIAPRAPARPSRAGAAWAAPWASSTSRPKAADLGLGADRDDDTLAGAGHHRAPGIEQRRTARRAARRRRQARAPWPPPRAPPSSSGLVGGQAVGLDDAGVGGHHAAGLDEQHIADHERVDRDCGHGALPADERVRGALQVAQRP